jgi:F0F1-type ATP synthase membrane subunit a
MKTRDRRRSKHLPTAALLIAILGSSLVPIRAFGAEESSLPRNAVAIARPFGFPITNSMLVTWLVALGLIAFVQLATRNMKQVPEGSQNFLEWLVGGLYGFLEGIIGPHLVQRTFWFFATIFIFILAANWVGLIPGVGTIGVTGARTASDRPAAPRQANADLSLTLAGASISSPSGSTGPSGRSVRAASRSDLRPKGGTIGV